MTTRPKHRRIERIVSASSGRRRIEILVRVSDPEDATREAATVETLTTGATEAAYGALGLQPPTPLDPDAKA